MNATIDVLELDLKRYELRRSGRAVKLERQPMELLILLSERPRELVTREEIVRRLWGDGIHLDTERGINNAIRKLRFALRDDPDHPRYLETVIGKGYRLLVALKTIPRSEPIVITPAPSTDAPPLSTQGKNRTASFHVPLAWRISAVFALLALAVGLAWWWRAHPTASPYVIAVLPLKNLSSEPNSDYFSDGLTDEIIRNLSILEGLEVKSRTSSFMFKDKPRDLHEVGRQLGVSLVLEGSVLRAGDKLRVNVELVRVSDDTTLWSQRYDRELKDVFAIQDEISRSMVNELRLRNVGGQRRYNTNLEAYDLYLKAQERFIRGGAILGPQSPIVEMFRQVIAKDPDFAPAYAQLADAYALLRSPRGYTNDAAVQMRAAANKAIELDPLLAEAWSAVGLVRANDLAWDDAEAAFRRAIQLNPNLPRIRENFATYVLVPEAKVNEAVRQYRKAVELDPLSHQARVQLAYGLIEAGDYAGAQDAARRALAAGPTPLAEQFYGRALVQAGKTDEGIKALQESGGTSIGYLGYAYAKLGRRAEAEQLADAEDVAQMRHRVTIYAGLGDNDRMFEALEQLAAANDFMADSYPVFPELAGARHDPRMKEFRRKRHLPWNF